VIVVGAYLVLAYPSVIADKSNTVSGWSSEKVSFIVGFPKGYIQVVFTVQGTAGWYAVNLLNSTGKVVWSIPATAVPASSTTTQSAWIPASGNFTVVVGYLASMTYTVNVLAKGAPF
jgi:hypothetical protein